jgi:hypothetical protein
MHTKINIILNLKDKRLKEKMIKELAMVAQMKAAREPVKMMATHALTT